MHRILFWLNCSRVFSLPMSVMSWLVVFVYALNRGGNVSAGIIAFFGISFAHLATNLIDDYVDYKSDIIRENSQDFKCEYIKSGAVTVKDLSAVIIAYCLIAILCGVILTYVSGFWVPVLALIGGLITLFYAKISAVGLSEAAVGIAFGPLLFEGVYFVMTGGFSAEVFVLSLAVVMFTIGLLYTHNLLDFDKDMCASKKTLACRLGNKDIALKVLGGIYFLGYLFTAMFAFMTKNLWVFSVYLTIPFAIGLYRSMLCGEGFYPRLFKARNLMVYYTAILTLVLINFH